MPRPGPGVEIAAGAPAEHRLGEQHAQPALEMAELLGGVTAVAALQQMLLDIGQQGAAAANRDVQETVVEAAILVRREFPMGAYAALAEFARAPVPAPPPRCRHPYPADQRVRLSCSASTSVCHSRHWASPGRAWKERSASLRFSGVMDFAARIPRPPGGFPQVRQNLGYPVRPRTTP